MKRFGLVLALAALGCGTTPEHTRRLYAPLSSPPSARDALASLRAYEDVEATDISCASVANGDITLGGIEAHLLGQLAEAQAEGDEASIVAHCEGDAAPWSCEVGARIVVEGDPWDYRITFTLSADGAIDPASIRCPGTG